jgi:hypothetical protein
MFKGLNELFGIFPALVGSSCGLEGESVVLGGFLKNASDGPSLLEGCHMSLLPGVFQAAICRKLLGLSLGILRL